LDRLAQPRRRGTGGTEELLARARENGVPGRPSFVLEGVRSALSRLGDPQDSIAPAFHVTGTNGKGSTTAFIRAVAEAAGLRVHVFTSPHLLSVHERIRLAGTLVSEEALASALERALDAGPGLSYFEALSVAAFLLFSQTPADICLIEVGAGGAGDATNVMRRPLACLVSPISRDHEALFGVEGVEGIARVKSGIFRRNVPAVIAPQEAVVMSVLRAEAERCGAEWAASPESWRCGLRDGLFWYEGERLQAKGIALSLPGDHQAVNAGLALAALERLPGWTPEPEAVRSGLGAAHWPARLQLLGAGALNPWGDRRILVDGAHNPGGAATLANELIRRGDAAQRVIVLAVQAAKDADAMLSALRPAAGGFVFCPLPESGGQEGGPGAEPSLLAARMGAPVALAGDLRSALDKAFSMGAAEVCVCGSLYLCAEALRLSGVSRLS